jgi:AraC family transcriptional regulator
MKSGQAAKQPTRNEPGMPARQIRRVVDCSGMHGFEAVYAPHTRLPRHEHAAPFFTYVLRGSFIDCIGKESRACVQGSVVFHAPCEAHANIVGQTGTASLNIEIAPDTWSELTEGRSGSAAVIGRVLSGDFEWLALHVWREFHRDDDGSRIALEEAIGALCWRLRNETWPYRYLSSRKLTTCMEYLSAHLNGAPRLSEVARHVGVHPMHLARLFRDRLGYSMGEYVRRCRIAWARDLLQQEESTIGEIAVRVGFADHAHFCRTFLRITGCTPSWYRGHVIGTRM